MSHDNKPTCSADSGPDKAKNQTSYRSPDTHSEYPEQTHDEDIAESNANSEAQIRPELIVDLSLSNTSSSDLIGSISSEQDAQSSSLNDGSFEDASASNHSIAELTEATKIQSERRLSRKNSSKHSDQAETPPICYNAVLDGEIRARLDRLNGLSTLINSLESEFDQANALFNETLKFSTEKLSAIAKSLGLKSIRKSRLYHEAKISAEQTQSACLKACIQFEQANIDHQRAKMAIKMAESKLKLIETNSTSGKNPPSHDNGTSYKTSLEIDISRLDLNRETDLKPPVNLENECDEVRNENASSRSTTNSSNDSNAGIDSETNHLDKAKLINSANLSEELNQAINRLVIAEEKRLQSEKLHLDLANKLMIAQENLTKLEREHGVYIRRTQIYFEEAARFDAKLKSVKSDITRISEDIVAAKKAYAETLTELEQFSEDLRIHINASNVIDSRPRCDR